MKLNLPSLNYPGISRENIRKSDGTAYDIKDLLKTNNRLTATSTKDSINWLSEPSNNKSLALQPYFCDICMCIQASPTKHCKLCETCVCKFDHHCLFINKCVGLKNHRSFITLVVFTLIAIAYYLVHLYSYLNNFYDNLNIQSIPVELQGSMLYYTMAETRMVWLFTLLVIDVFGLCMVTVLLYFQFKFLSLGYTQQFPQPILFVKANKRMQSFMGALTHRMENLYIFFFESCEANEQLWYKQQNSYISVTSTNKIIPMDCYPRDSDYADNIIVGTFIPTTNQGQNK